MGTESTRKVDTLIAGGGIAGLFLARALRQRGKSVLVVQDAAGLSAFPAAVGLLNPVRGQRCTLPWRAASTFPHARKTYEAIDRESGRRAFRPVPVVRVFAGEEERVLWESHRDAIEDAGFRTSFAEAPAFWKNAAHGAGAVEGGAMVEIKALRVSMIEALRAGDAFAESVCAHDALAVDSGGVVWRGRDLVVEAGNVVLCGGIADHGSPLLPAHALRPLKGESLSIHVFNLPDNAAYVCGNHLASMSGDLWRCGGTREADSLDMSPTAAARAALEAWLARNLALPYSVEAQHAGIRPSTPDRLPIVGPVPGRERVFVCNGLGSQGLSWGPWLADCLANHLVSNESIPTEILPSRFIPRRRSTDRFHAVDIARSHATAALRVGDTAVDLTTGNGGDTHWLAEAVGASGHVFGFDIQPEAIHATRRRLETAGLAQRATLFCTDHAQVMEHVPASVRGGLGAVVANLGYLPGSDSPIITRPDTTVKALAASISILRPGGVLVAVVYPGHEGGRHELEAVQRWADALDQNAFSRLWETDPAGHTGSPRVLVVKSLSR